MTNGNQLNAVISAERNYSATETECLSNVWAPKTLLFDILETPFTVHTDLGTRTWMMPMSYHSDNRPSHRRYCTLYGTTRSNVPYKVVYKINDLIISI